jgi:hypothetical protein
VVSAGRSDCAMAQVVKTRIEIQDRMVRVSITTRRSRKLTTPAAARNALRAIVVPTAEAVG